MSMNSQAEDGIRDYKVTGVQTCALPIWIKKQHEDHRHTFFAVILMQLLDPVLVKLRLRAVIARGHENEHWALRIVIKLVNRPVHSGQRKVRRRRANGQRPMRAFEAEAAARKRHERQGKKS